MSDLKRENCSPKIEIGSPKNGTELFESNSNDKFTSDLSLKSDDRISRARNRDG